MLVELLVIALTVVVSGLLRTELERTPRESGVLLLVDVLFVAWMVAETHGITSLVPGFGP